MGVPTKSGDPCPCARCKGVIVTETDGPNFSYPLCPECGYCPEEDFDHLIDDCPSCGAFSYVINQGNIVCSGCSLELTDEDEESAIARWNSMPRKPKESNHVHEE